ncbi:MAG: four helix bundle protein [Bacteroidales bacterium]|nr:four helix bundle protein [Bacteroidales bacterium]
MEENVTSFFRFEDLRVYDKSLQYYNWLISKVQSADEFNRKVIMLPFIDTATKICMQIADGSSNPKTEFVEYLKYAKGLVRQCVVFSTMALDNNVFTQEDMEKSREMLMEMTKMLGAMIVSFQRSINNRNGNTDNSRQREERTMEDFSSLDSEFNY